MKRILLLIFCITFCFDVILAVSISEEVARKNALEFFHSNIQNAKKMPATKNSKTNKNNGNIVLETAEVQNAFYVFNVGEDDGYVIASSDDRMPTVLGYSLNGHFDPKSIPDNMRSLLQDYSSQHEYLQQHPESAPLRVAIVGDAISPLIRSNWEQGPPYNDQCPLINGEHAVTGCVATAMAQIMYYHQWPTQTTKPIPAYTTYSSGISMPEIGITTIDWSNMLPSYSNPSQRVQKDAVAKLMLLCGSAIEMDYGVLKSCVFIHMVEKTLTEYFGYNKYSVNYLYRDDFSDLPWNQMIYDELAEDRPVLYSGSSDKIEHAFVVDGYNGSGYFHVNFGWGGSQDNYFLLSSVNGYNSLQTAIIGITTPNKPIKCAYTVQEDSVLTYYYDNKADTRTGQSSSLQLDYYNRRIITDVVFDPSFAEYNYLPYKCRIFKGMGELRSVKDIKYLNTQSVTDMSEMFDGCSSLTNLDLRGFNTANVTNMSMMFFGCSGLTNLDMSSFNTSNVTNMSSMFSGCCKLETIYVGEGWNTDKVESSYWFGNYISNNMFFGCTNLIGDHGTVCDGDNTDVSYAHLDGGMDNPGYFSKVGSIVRKPYFVLSEDKTTLTFYFGTDMESRGGTRLKPYYYHRDIPWVDNSPYIKEVVFDDSFDNCGSFTSTANWFYGCSNLTTIKGIEKINTGNVTNMSSMFYDCSSLTNLDLSSFNTNNVDCMYEMFYDCSSLTNLDLSSFNTSKVTHMRSMFTGCSSLTNLDLSSFNTENVWYMGSMFSNCNSLTEIFVNNWNIDKVEYGSEIFSGCTKLVGGMGTKYDENHTDYTYARIDGGQDAPGYFTYKAAVMKGDVNFDSKVDVEDVVGIVNKILGEPAANFNEAAADVNGDGKIDVEDVVATVNIILGE